MDHKTAVRAVVTSIDRRRKGKEYAITKLAKSSSRPSGLSADETVTFSLSEWKGSHVPVSGQIVELYDMEKFTKGWRARLAKPVRA